MVGDKVAGSGLPGRHNGVKIFYSPRRQRGNMVMITDQECGWGGWFWARHGTARGIKKTREFSDYGVILALVLLVGCENGEGHTFTSPFRSSVVLPKSGWLKG